MSALAQRETPYSELVGQTLEPDYFLTHVLWVPGDEYDIARPQPETGVRRVRDGEIDRESFFLIQHGWNRWDVVEPVILRCLRKGRSVDQICNLIERLRRRSLPKAVRA